MKKHFKFISFVISISLICTLLSGFTSENDTNGETSKIVRDEKVFCAATIDQEFDDSSVLVIMDNVTCGINRQHELSFLGDTMAISVI